jgi:hypothetical protein
MKTSTAEALVHWQWWSGDETGNEEHCGDSEDEDNEVE